MLFNIERDTGDCVIGYCVPDGFEATPILRVHSSGAVLARFEANELRQALVEAGRHQTGRCGFCITEAEVAGLAGIEDLAIDEEDSGLLIYRRPQPGYLQRKVVRLETHLFPLWRLDDAVKPRFQHFIRGVEALGRETVTQLLLLNDVGSSYLSGRILYKNYAYFIDNGFDVCMFVQDPHTEFAERLLILSKIRKAGLSVLGPRDAMVYETAIHFAESLPFDNDRALKRALRSIPGEVAQQLANPLARQMTAATPNEMPSGGAIASALDAFASFAAIGLRDEPETALDGFSALAGAECSRLPRLAKSGAAEALGAMFADSRVIDSLIETDRELYHHLSEAARRAAASTQRAAHGA
jgi:hypothetical protein